MARVAIVGVGAIGGVAAVMLENTGRHEVLPCMRRALALTVETPQGTRQLRAKPLTEPANVEPADWVLISTKTYDVAGTAAWLRGLRSTGTPVAVLQNGVEHRERFAPYLPANSILPMVVDCAAERMGADRIRQRSPMNLKVPQGELGRSFVELFAGTPVQIEETPDFLTAAWKKLCLNSAGILSALLLRPAGVMHERPVADLAAQIVRECIAVGTAEGAKLSNTEVESVLQTYRAMPPDAINSMHADRLAGRAMEIDARNGAIVRLGEKHGIPTPVNRTAITLLEALRDQR
jgi:2-dehydropantoate 2-reductase